MDVAGPWKNFSGECKLGLCQQRALELREGLEGRDFPFSFAWGGGSSSYAFQVLWIWSPNPPSCSRADPGGLSSETPTLVGGFLPTPLPSYPQRCLRLSGGSSWPRMPLSEFRD